MLRNHAPRDVSYWSQGRRGTNASVRHLTHWRPSPALSTIESQIRDGFAVHPVIVRMANEWQVDLIVMATHGRKGFSHLVLGSIAERVIREATCPVLVVRPRRPIDIEFGAKTGVGLHLRFVQMILTLLHGLFVNSDQLPGLKDSEVPLRNLENQIKLRKLLVRRSRGRFKPALRNETAVPAEVEQKL